MGSESYVLAGLEKNNNRERATKQHYQVLNMKVLCWKLKMIVFAEKLSCPEKVGNEDFLFTLYCSL